MNRSHLDTELRLVKDGLLAMAGVAEEMIRLTIRAYTEKQDGLAEEVLRMGATVDEMEVRLDQACIDLLALQSPMGSDLRFVTSAFKILPEIERIGDHCENIARRAPLLNHLEQILPPGLLEALGQETTSMMRRSVDAFVATDSALARGVIDSDDKVDEIYNHCYRELVRKMVSDPLCIERASHLIIVIKNWERIGDMATNIAEEVIFIAEGVSAKHQYLSQAEGQTRNGTNT